MPDRILEAYLRRISQLVEAHMGLDFPQDRWHVLRRALKKASSTLGFADVQSFVRWLLEWPFAEKRSEMLAPYLTVGETYFFRDAKLFEALENSLLPQIIKSRRADGRRLTIWSAGCASGEEPYSVAILLDKLIPDRIQWDVTILGTDINERSLERANAGLYTEWSFRNFPDEVRDRYFRQKGKEFEIIPQIKERVEFAYLNLARHPYPDPRNSTEKVDIIICRNVLMYLTPKWQQSVVDKFVRCLLPDGWLVVTSPETSCILNPELVLAKVPGVAWFYRDGQRPPEYTVPDEDKPPVFIPIDVVETPPESPLWTLIRQEEPDASTHPFAEKSHEPETSVERPKDHLLIGFSLYEQGDYEAATERLMAALKNDQLQDSESIAATSLITRSFANQGQLDKALEWSERTLVIDKLNPEFHYLHGTILQEKGDREAAKKAFLKAIFADPDFVVAHVALCNIARAEGKTAEAQRHGATALTILGSHNDEEIVVGTEGMTARRLRRDPGSYRRH